MLLARVYVSSEPSSLARLRVTSRFLMRPRRLTRVQPLPAERDIPGTSLACLSPPLVLRAGRSLWTHRFGDIGALVCLCSEVSKMLSSSTQEVSGTGRTDEVFPHPQGGRS